MLFCLSVLPVSPPRGSLKIGGYDLETKSERMALNLHVSPVYASGCILFKLSVDPLCLMQSYLVVPNNPDFSSCSYDIAVISNAISCAYELRIPLSSAFTATHSRFQRILTSCQILTVIVKTGFRCKTSSQAISNLTTTSPTEKTVSLQAPVSLSPNPVLQRIGSKGIISNPQRPSDRTERPFGSSTLNRSIQNG